jgi:hypothetical protein
VYFCIREIGCSRMVISRISGVLGISTGGGGGGPGGSQGRNITDMSLFVVDENESIAEEEEGKNSARSTSSPASVVGQAVDIYGRTALMLALINGHLGTSETFTFRGFPEVSVPKWDYLKNSSN